jgi:hypothetical protein
VEQISISEGICGDWSISKFVVGDKEAMSSMFAYRSRYVPKGTYTKLCHKVRGVVMSDTPAEMRDHSYAVYKATGSVLINGLGIGMVLKNILAKPDVTDVTVIELEQDVIDLVAHHYQDPRLTIICADAYEWKPPKGKRYNMVWHDIWDAICSDNLKLMEKLHRKYGRICDWQGSWGKENCIYQRNRWKR